MDAQQEIENTADDDQWWQIIKDLTEDLSEQQVSGSVLTLFAIMSCLVVVVAIAPGFFRLVAAYWSRNK